MLPTSVSFASPSGVKDKRELNWSGATGVSLPMRVQIGARGCTSNGLPTVGKYSFMGLQDPEADASLAVCEGIKQAPSCEFECECGCECFETDAGPPSKR